MNKHSFEYVSVNTKIVHPCCLLSFIISFWFWRRTRDICANDGVIICRIAERLLHCGGVSGCRGGSGHYSSRWFGRWWWPWCLKSRMFAISTGSSFPAEAFVASVVLRQGDTFGAVLAGIGVVLAIFQFCEIE